MSRQLLAISILIVILAMSIGLSACKTSSESIGPQTLAPIPTVLPVSTVPSTEASSDLLSKLLTFPLPKMDPDILQHSKEEILAWIFEVSQWKVNVMNLPNTTFGEDEEKAVEQELGKIFTNPKIIKELIHTFYAYDTITQMYSKKEINYAYLQPGWNEYKLDVKKQSETHYDITVKSKMKNSDMELYLTNRTLVEITNKGMMLFDFTDIPSDQDPDTWPHQIVDDEEAFPGIDMHIKTIWTGKIQGAKYNVYTGYKQQDKRQGMAIINDSKEGETVQFFQVQTSKKEGALRAVTDDGVRVILQSEEGKLYALNVQTHQLEEERIDDTTRGAQLPITFVLEKDLDGDGNPEKLVLSGTKNTDAPFSFTINGKVQDIIKTMLELKGMFQVVDLDVSDHSKQLAFPESGPSGMNATSIFQYNKETGDMSLLGRLPGSGEEIRYLSNGKIITKSQRAVVLSTWFHEQTYVWTKQGLLEPLKQDLYKANLNVTLKKSLSLYESRTNRKSAGTLKAGNKAVIEQSDNKKWFYIRGKNGVKGWFEVRDFSFVINADIDAGELFDGLNNAG